MSRWITTTKPSVLPIYAVGLVWLVCGFALPLYRLWALALAAVLSFLGFKVTQKLCPPRTCRVEVPFMTGSEDTDAMLESIQQGVDQLKALDDAIADEDLSAAIRRMAAASEGIIEAVMQDTQKAKLVRRFVNHYLPDAIKILTVYARMDRGSFEGENARAVRRQVEGNAGVIASAFEKQLDSLFAAEALDLSTDIEVLGQMMKGQGLTGSGPLV